MKHVLTALASLMLPLVNPPVYTSAAHHAATFAVSKPAKVTNPAGHIRQVMVVEGGYQNYPDDMANTGIGTKYGITPRTWQKYKGKGKLPTAKQMKSLSKAEAMRIYTLIWHDAGMYLLPDEVAGEVFDAYVNTPQTALQIIERITGKRGCAQKMAIDSATARAIGRLPAGTFTRQLKEARTQYYRYRAGKYNNSSWHRFFRAKGKTGNPRNSKYLEGWLKRLE